MDTIREIQTGDGDRSLNPDLVFDGIIATFYEKTNDQQDVLTLLEKMDAPLLGIIKRRQMFPGMLLMGNRLS